MKTAIVLSGGGAKGAYQVGFYRAIRELNIKYDIVTGTSVGALNGAFLVEQDYNKLYNSWKNISYKDIYGIDMPIDVEKLELFKTHAKAFIKEGGMDTTSLEDIFVSKIDVEKIKNSPIDFGITTFNLTDFKPVYKTKKELLKSHMTDYILASASIYPAFKTKVINKKEYIDGGYFDQIPIDLALKMGADKIIAVDLKGYGFVKPLTAKIDDIITISLRHNIGTPLEFNKKTANDLFKYGYNDTMKAFNKFDGDYYTFRKDILVSTYNKYSEQMRKLLFEIFSGTKEIPEGFKKILKGKIFNDILVKSVETLGKDFRLDDRKIYTLQGYNLRIILRYRPWKKYKPVNPIYKYQKIYEALNKKDYSKLRKMAIIYNREFLSGIYLYLIKKRFFV